MIDSLEILEHTMRVSPVFPHDDDPQSFSGVKNLLLDVDDTLWENNIFFLASVEWVCREGRKLGFPDRATMGLLEHWETFNISRKGYGYDSYHASVLATITAMVKRAGAERLHGGIYHQARLWYLFLRQHPIAWRNGVMETLPELTKRFRVVLVTKGHQGDQMGKIDRCGIKDMFFGAEVVPHKYPGNYRNVLTKYGFEREETVMIGNSPRSDINMAKAAGLRTVYIPHHQTWYREMEPIERGGPPTIQLEKFAGLPGVLKA